MSAIEDRRHMAWCVAVKTDRDVEEAPVDAAVEYATRVRITDEVIDAFGVGWHEADTEDTLVKGARRRAGLKAALAALGFEVVE